MEAPGRAEHRGRGLRVLPAVIPANRGLRRDVSYMMIVRLVPTLLLMSSVAFGDIVHLRSGGRIEGKVTDKGPTLEIENVNGKVTVEKDLVESIEKKDYVPPKGGMPARKPVMDLYFQVSKRDLPELVTAYKDAFRKGVKDVTFLYEEATAVRDKQGYQFSVTFTDGELPVVQQALFMFIADGDRKYVLGFNTSQAWFDRYYPVVDASMRSFRIFPMPSLSAEDKKRFLVRYQSGEQYYKESKLAEALTDFQAAEQLCPEFADLHSTIATIQMKLSRYPDAEAEYRKAAEADPDDAAHPYNLGVCLLKQSKSEGAIDALKKSAALDGTFEPALTNLGAAYLGKDQNDSARQALEKAIVADPESAPAHYNLGLAYERLDRSRDAERQYKEALSADPKHDDARKALDRVKSRK